MKNSVWFSVLGTAVLGSSIGMASSSLPLQPQDCMQTKIRKQVEDGAMQTLIDEGLYRLHEGDEDSPQAKGLVAAQVALGVTQQDVDEKGSLLVRLERGTTQISELDCALHHLSARFAQYQVERRKDMNSIVGMMNKILENDQLIQAFMIAHGSTMLDSFEPDEHETTTYDVLKNRAKVFTDFIRNNDSIFTYPYSGSDLIQQEVQHYFDHSPLVDCICGEKHKEGTLCDKIYKCSTCGSNHLKGTLCPNTTIEDGQEPAPSLEGFDFNSQFLTLTGNEVDDELLIEEGVRLSEARTVRSLTSAAGQAIYSGPLTDTGNAGSLTILGGSHTFCTTEGSTVNTLSVSEGATFSVGSDSDAGTLTLAGSADIQGTLNVAEKGTLKVQGASTNVSGTTTNNGRVEILNIGEDQGVRFGPYQGKGNTYIAPDITMEVVFHNTCEHPGNFEGEGHLVTSGYNNAWSNMGGGTLKTLTVNGLTAFDQAEGAEPLVITEKVTLNKGLSLGRNTFCSLTCESFSIGLEASVDLVREGTQLVCLGEFRQDSNTSFYSHVDDGAVLTTKTFILGGGHLGIGTSGGGVGRVSVEDKMSTADGTKILLGYVVGSCSGQLSVGGVLTLDGSIDVYRLVGEDALVLGGLEGSGTINLRSGPMTINFTRDCVFPGQITGSGNINLHSETPITFTWPQRALFTGTLNKDDTVTIVES